MKGDREISCYECHQKETSRIHREGHENYHPFKPPLWSDNVLEHTQYLRKPTPHHLWAEAQGDPHIYLALMRSSGHIEDVKRDPSFTILCTGRRGRERKFCSYCDSFSDRLCDARITSTKTCDRRLCRRCSIRVGTDHDYCKAHREQAKEHAARLREEAKERC